MKQTTTNTTTPNKHPVYCFVGYNGLVDHNWVNLAHPRPLLTWWTTWLITKKSTTVPRLRIKSGFSLWSFIYVQLELYKNTQVKMLQFLFFDWSVSLGLVRKQWQGNSIFAAGNNTTCSDVALRAINYCSANTARLTIITVRVPPRHGLTGGRSHGDRNLKQSPAHQ